MDLFGSSFGYDFYSPPGSYNLQPEDINPALRNGYIRDVADYYSEPPVSRYRPKKQKPIKSCGCGKSHQDMKLNTTLYILIIILIVITVIQWMVIFFSGNNAVTINHHTTIPMPNLPMSTLPIAPALPTPTIVAPVDISALESK